jgi:hypothetical protein
VSTSRGKKVYKREKTNTIAGEKRSGDDLLT